MILYLSGHPENKKCAENLANQYGIKLVSSYPTHFSNNKTNKLFIVDIAGNIASLEEEKFPENLVKIGLLDSCKDIFLLMSDVNIKKSLIVFANNLAIHFLEKHNLEIKIHVPAQINYDMTLLIPSLTTEQWAIYGLHKEDTCEVSDIEILRKIENKKMLWEGKDIIHYLETPHQTYTGISYAWKE